MKKYKISYYSNGVNHTRIIEAKSKDDALNKAWGLIDADDIYVSEVTE